MDRDKETSGASGTLPRPELNPMLNPLLGQNMGRWAEVYYTAIPERREEAVMELLRQLEAETGATPRQPSAPSPAAFPQHEPWTESGQDSSEEVRTETSAEENVSQVAEPDFRVVEPGEIAVTDELEDVPLLNDVPARAQTDESRPDESWHAESRVQPGPEPEPPVPPSVYARDANEQHTTQTAGLRCAVCEHENPGTNLYCGLCGAALQRPPAPEPEWRPAAQHEPERWTPEPARFDRQQQAAEPELFLYGGRQFEEEPSGSYRGYVIAALIVLVAVLGYMAWRSAQAARNPRPNAIPPGATLQQRFPTYSPPVESVAPANGTQQTESTPAPATPPTTATPPKQIETSGVEPKHAKPVRQNAAAKDPIATAKPSEATPPPSSDNNGSAELAAAEQYLNGSDGVPRNTAAAAQWLWKSISKHNGQAMLQLADLYLRGDGVSKNCDQARVLLDSAARKGVGGAGERLRNLAAFGCQ